VAEDIWVARDTTPDAIEAALRELLHRRHAEDETLAPARVLNLVVIVDREWKGEIANRLERVGRYHASRTVLCAVEENRETLDARVVMTNDDAQDRVGVIREEVEIDLGPEHLERLETILDPVLVGELPTILWSPHGHEQAVDSLRGRIDVMLLDSDDGAAEPVETLARAREMVKFSYVVDLAWLRTTPWRERLAASFDPAHRRVALEQMCGLAVRHRASSAASALLLSGWLASRLQWQPGRLESSARGQLSGVARRNGGTEAGAEVHIELDPADLEVPGLAGVTVSWDGGRALSLDRGDGGLCAKYETSGEADRIWQILGASRGEGGILGEGVRQALLRDPTYGPALDAALEFCP
jgi:glucose-6-phosphate dehydrogenase assembly protein OpcA